LSLHLQMQPIQTEEREESFVNTPISEIENYFQAIANWKNQLMNTQAKEN